MVRFKRVVFHVTFIALMLVASLALLKLVDTGIFVFKSRSILVPDSEVDEPSMRTFNYYPYDGEHIQAYKHEQGRVLWTNYYQDFNVQSGDHGFFVDFDLDYPPAKAPDEFRIILTGGSAAQGWGGRTNNDMFYKKLEVDLNKELSARSAGVVVKIINLAMGATVSYQNFIALNRWGHNLKPDMIISFSGHNEVAVPASVSNSDINWSGADYAAASMILQYPRSPNWLKKLAKFFPGIVLRTGFGNAVRSQYANKYKHAWMVRYWLGRYDSNYHGQLNDREAEKRYWELQKNFNVENQVVVPMYEQALESIRRDFPDIPLLIAFQPLNSTPDIYRNVRDILMKRFEGRGSEKIYAVDVHAYWEKNDFFPGSLVDSCHLSNKGHEIVSQFLTEKLIPIILDTLRPVTPPSGATHVQLQPLRK